MKSKLNIRKNQSDEQSTTDNKMKKMHVLL